MAAPSAIFKVVDPKDFGAESNMNLLAVIQDRFRTALAGLVDDPQEVSKLVDLVRPSQDPKFGDYQANFAMPLSKRLGKSSREVAQQVVDTLKIADLCDPPEVAGPGFINLRVKNDQLTGLLHAALADDRLGVTPVAKPRKYVIDYSSPNVAKPMHVGHIRSTVIGAALDRTLRFLGHKVISDNHIGDWGTQFGMMIYGFKHFRDEAGYKASAVKELGRLYRLVNQLVEYHDSKANLPKLSSAAAEIEADIAAQAKAPPPADKNAQKQAAKTLSKLQEKLKEKREEIASTQKKIATVDGDTTLSSFAKAHLKIGEAVLAETAKLHGGDPENLLLWKEFLPPCLVELSRIYERLDVTFDHTLGESFYHDRLPGVVEDLAKKNLARESNGAVCVFLDGYEAPMIVQKQDGAFLYATTDLATIQYRASEWKPDAVLYVVDHRQSLHFEQLFATAKLWGYDQMELKHVSFGTVLGDDGRPFKTRSGDTVGLDSLLDEGIERAAAVVREKDDAKRDGAELSEEQRAKIARVVGIAALKYADLSQNRTSDYVFSYDKMLAMKGNTATYMQFAYARVFGIFAEGSVDVEFLRRRAAIDLGHAAERSLAIGILQFSEALENVRSDYRPDFLTGYLFELANRYSTFYDQCHVLKAETDALRTSRLQLCDLTARVLKQGLTLLGIQVVDKM